jgi:hypothetical protein
MPIYIIISSLLNITLSLGKGFWGEIPWPGQKIYGKNGWFDKDIT